MFTGIVEEIGEVELAELRDEDAMRLTVKCNTALDGTQIGDSIAVNGVCLTVTELDENSFTTTAVLETLRRTNIDCLRTGSSVNLERSATLEKTIGGHYVQGHIDGVAQVKAIEAEGEALNYYFETSTELMRYIVPKGFVGVDGASLTVVETDAQGFSVTLISHTQKWTVMGKESVGYQVNIEVDVMGKYIEKMIDDRLSSLEQRLSLVEANSYKDFQQP